MSDSAFRLDGRVALVTGGSRGIGRAVALALAQAGADVVVAARKAQDLDSVAEEVRSLGRRGLAVPAHLARRADIDRLFESTLEAFGRLDVLVNNAATNPVFGPLADIEEDAWDRIMALNVKGYLLAAQRAARAMAPLGRGVIINMASTAGLRASPGLGAYSVSKA
ncbi:MAG TPA: SDR family NAD(P)-dependent oxidoreductase, partial [Methylomirabilota bacterium]|nr:SDR family NAD(P)-dependent oxidoreductase [Methylomirabilota bacterium]